MPGWKKLALVSFCGAVGVTVALLLSAAAFYQYTHRSRPRKDWPTISLRGSGIQASFYSEMRSGSVLYGFVVKPLDPDFFEAFDMAASSDPDTKKFSIVLRDAGGFSLCSTEVRGLTAVVDDSGKTTALTSDGVFAFCSMSEYLEAESWDLTYQFPKLQAKDSAAVKAEFGRLLSDPKFLSLPPARQRETLHKLTGDHQFTEFSDAQTKEFIEKMRIEIESRKPTDSKAFAVEDRLSSFDPSQNVLVTDSGTEFTIPAEAHIKASRWWHSGNSEVHCPLRVSCDSKGDCKIENRWNSQTIDAKLVKRGKDGL